MIPSLDREACRERQLRLAGLLERLGLDAAVLTNRGYVHALTGYWHPQPLTAVGVVVRVDGATACIAPEGSGRPPVANEDVRYDATKLATIIEDPFEAMADALSPLLHDFHHVGYCHSIPVAKPAGLVWRNISREYQYLRRRKDPDEIELLRFAIETTEAAFSEARSLIASRPTEIEVHAAIYARVLNAVGEQLSGWGNDFQSNSPGGAPRRRRMNPGELAVYDLGVGVRGYRSDLCRTFVVDSEPNDLQRRAHARVVEALFTVERKLRPGVECRALYSEIESMLDGWSGYAFTHHLGHGIGLDAHEVPRLNPEWDDTLAEGDVVAIEPALYGEDLRAGIRLEHNYLITASGFDRLSSFPLDM